MQRAALILAAGKGTRMHCAKPKVLLNLLEQPLLSHVLRALRGHFHEQIWTVIGHGAQEVRAAFAKEPMHFVEQMEQKGTGHAVVQALPALQAAHVDFVLVVNGDTPLLSFETVQHFLDAVARAGHPPVAFASIHVPYANSYGRVVRDNAKQVIGIVEAKDYNAAMYGDPTGEVNAGLYLLHIPTLAELLPQLSSENESHEYYLTDVVQLAVHRGYAVCGVMCGENAQLLGVNSPQELSHAEEILRVALVEKAMVSGVLIHNPQSVVLGAEIKLEPGAEIFGPCEIYGTSVIATGAVVRSHCVLYNATIEQGAQIHSFSHIQDAVVGKNASVGPYGRLRPGAKLEEKSKIGNFVEVKKATLHAGAKVNHLSYIGDASIGEAANIGAGTITCNYDGKNKFQTSIGARAFIGSNTALVAPVHVGDDALIGAGSVITKDVLQGELGIARTRQKNLPKKK